MNAKRLLSLLMAAVMLVGIFALTSCDIVEKMLNMDDTTAEQETLDTTLPVGDGTNNDTTTEATEPATDPGFDAPATDDPTFDAAEPETERTEPDETVSVTEPTGDDEEPEKEDAEPTTTKNYSGRTSRILAITGSSILEGQLNDSQIISDALANRRRYVEQKYGIEMSLTAVDSRNDMVTLQSSFLAGYRTYDFIAPHPTTNLALLMMSGMLQDLGDSAMLGGHIDITKIWWNQSQVEAFAVNDKLFIGAPDMNLNKRGVSVLVMNKDIWNSMYQADVHDVVFDGKWTLDKMIEAVNDSYNKDAADYGFVGHTNCLGGFYIGVGGTLLVNDEDGDWVHKYDVDFCSTLAQKLYAFAIGHQALLENYTQSSYATGNAWKAFYQGKALIQAMDVDYFGKMLASVDFGVAYLPYPKLNYQQKTYLGGNGAGFMGIPNDAKDLEFCGLIMETFNWYTYRNFRPVYFGSYLSPLNSPTANDYKVIEMAVNNTVYDLGIVLDSTGLDQGTAAGMWTAVIVKNLSTDVASYIENHEEANNVKFQEILKEID